MPQLTTNHFRQSKCIRRLGAPLVTACYSRPCITCIYIAFIAFFFKMVGHFLFCWCSFREMEASISFGLVMSLVSGLCVLLLLPCSAMAQPPRLAPASFVFGDSLADPGNNNYITTLSKANTPPNGIDFPGGKATGRYCNGRTTVDIVGKLTSL
jgi:hypothetical protein